MEEKNKSFCLENASDLTDEFFATILTKKFTKIFLFELSQRKIPVSNLMHFQDETIHLRIFYFLLRKKSVNQTILYHISII